MANEKENKLKQILSEAIHSGKQNPIYLASGFFNKSQNELLTSLESLLNAQGAYFISPRHEGVIDPKNPMRSALMDQIYKRNVESIEMSDKAYFILDTTLGGFDLGTVWEYGYAIGDYLKSEEKSIDNLVPYTPNDETAFMFNQIKNNLQEYYIYLNSPGLKDSKNDPNQSIKLLTKDNLVNFSLTKKLLGYNFDQLNVDALLNMKSQTFDEVLVCIDNKPFQLSILMGFFKAIGIKYTTCSFKGYGSNIMISCSSEGHINLPGIHDDKKNPNTNIL